MRPRVTVLVGDDPDVWDIRLSREVHREFGCSAFEHPSLTILVDPDTGETSLLTAHRAGSAADLAERSLFEGMHEEIMEAMTQRFLDHPVPETMAFLSERAFSHPQTGLA